MSQLSQERGTLQTRACRAGLKATGKVGRNRANGFKSWLYLSLAVWLWIDHISTNSLGFLIYKVGVLG